MLTSLGPAASTLELCIATVHVFLLTEKKPVPTRMYADKVDRNMTLLCDCAPAVWLAIAFDDFVRPHVEASVQWLLGDFED